MNKLILTLALLLASIGAKAQLGTAPDFTVTDIAGNEINLYEILDQGIIAVVDVSATWCGPCWSLHQSHALQDLHELYGPDGTNQVRVMFYEGDAGTTLEDLQGTGTNTEGDWLTGTTYPVINETPISLDLGFWAASGFPTVHVIRPSDYEVVADTWDIFTLDGQVAAIEEGTGIDLGVVGVSELKAEDILLYPNPSQDIVTLNLGEINKQVTIIVSDVLGKVVRNFVSNNNTEVLDFSELEVGSYLVQVASEDSRFTKRISIIR